MLIRRPFEIQKTSECDAGDVVELSINGETVFAVVISAFDQKLMVGLYSSERDYAPTIYPTTDAWDEDCFYYPNAVLEVVRTESLAAADPIDGQKVGSLRMVKDTLSVRASTMSRPVRQYWIDLVEAARAPQNREGTEFYVTRWRLWADAEHRSIPGASPLADVTAQSPAPR